MKNLLISFFLLTIFSSCIVTKKKYDDLLAQKVSMEADLADRNAQLEKANADLRDLEAQLQKLKEDTTSLGIDVRSTSERLAELEREHGQ